MTRVTHRVRRKHAVRRSHPPGNIRRTALPRIHPISVRGRGISSVVKSLRTGPLLVLQNYPATTARQPSRPDHLRFRARMDVLLPLLLLCLSLVQNLDHVSISPFHRDEARWIGRAHFLERAFDPFSETWSDFYLTSTQPPFGSYVMGLGLILQGRDLTTNSIWDFNYSQEWNEQAGAMPEAADLNAGRRMNALLGALLTLTVYFIGKQLSNRVGATIGALFIALHPLQILLASQALSDITLTFLLALLFLVSLRLARYPTWTNSILLAALMGLGGSAKLAPLLLSLPVAGLGAFLLARSRSYFSKFTDSPAKDRNLAFKLLPTPIMAFAFFAASYPYLWVDPIHRTIKMFSFRADEMQSQGTIWPGLAVNSPLEALARAGTMLGETSSTSGRLSSILMNLIGVHGHPLPAGLDFIPAIAGIVLLGGLVIRHGLRSKYALVSVLMASELGAFAFGMKADFNRYYLPVVLLMSICIAIATSLCWSLLARYRFWRIFNVVPGVHVVTDTSATASKPLAAEQRSVDNRWERSVRIHRRNQAIVRQLPVPSGTD